MKNERCTYANKKGGKSENNVCAKGTHVWDKIKLKLTMF